MKKYKIDPGIFKANIKVIEVTRETHNFVFYTNMMGREIRESKKSNAAQWFDTWDEAHTALIVMAKRRVKMGHEMLDLAKTTEASVKAMARPNEEISI